MRYCERGARRTGEQSREKDCEVQLVPGNVVLTPADCEQIAEDVGKHRRRKARRHEDLAQAAWEPYDASSECFVCIRGLCLTSLSSTRRVQPSGARRFDGRLCSCSKACARGWFDVDVDGARVGRENGHVDGIEDIMIQSSVISANK